MTEFTPRPWKVAFRKNSNDFSTDDVMSDTEPSRRICDVYGGTTCETGLANAHLIAAAPEMYAALEMALEDVQELIQIKDGSVVHRKMKTYLDTRDAIVAALAKARGETP